MKQSTMMYILLGMIVANLAAMVLVVAAMATLL